MARRRKSTGSLYGDGGGLEVEASNEVEGTLESDESVPTEDPAPTAAPDESREAPVFALSEVDGGVPLAAVFKRRRGRTKTDGAEVVAPPPSRPRETPENWDIVLTDAFRVESNAPSETGHTAPLPVIVEPPVAPPDRLPPPPPPPPPPPLTQQPVGPPVDDVVEESIEAPDDTEPAARVSLHDFPPDIDPATAVDAVLGFSRRTAGARRTPSAGAWFSELFNADFFLAEPARHGGPTEREADFIAECLGLQPGARLLDLACGYGRHALVLSARGYEMVGLDLSLDMLKTALARAQTAALAIKFVHGDMRDLNFQQVFDGAYCVDTSFGYFSEPENLMVLRGLYEALKPSGRLLIDVTNRDYCLRTIPTRNWWEGDGCLVQEDIEFDHLSSRVAIKRFSVYADGTQQESNISIRLYALHELTRMLQVAGFDVVEVSGHRHTRGLYFGAESARLIVVAQKAQSPKR